jgi:drug/metabolite transporter (DMT)-like permease
MGGLFTRVIQLDNWTMLAWRGIFGALGLIAVMVALRQRHVWQSLRNMGWMGWLYVVQSAAGMAFYLTALRHTSVANVAVIYATAPFLAAGLGWLVMRERPTTSSIVASGVGLCGVALMVGFGKPGGWLGDLLALGMTWSMATTMVVARHYRDIPIMLTACISSLLSGLLSWPFGTPLAVTGHDLMLLALFGIVNFAIGLPLFTYGARLLPPIETALIGAVDAPLAPLWVWLAFDETPGVTTIIGGTLVFVAVAVHLIVGESSAFKKATVAAETTGAA